MSKGKNGQGDSKSCKEGLAYRMKGWFRASTGLILASGLYSVIRLIKSINNPYSDSEPPRVCRETFNKLAAKTGCYRGLKNARVRREEWKLHSSSYLSPVFLGTLAQNISWATLLLQIAPKETAEHTNASHQPLHASHHLLLSAELLEQGNESRG